ncbi:uncharacterized protein LOC122511283 [Leptopilina heterotoma]|uniref:uncharacterized protein LOC122511283 n=1 Tax=Leptopilina heterotoma TaxID=63436 RepID=UPI001CA8DF78|nr:uncharacterized protein LOC122511283 [Leptopilina heterotoma]
MQEAGQCSESGGDPRAANRGDGREGKGKTAGHGLAETRRRDADAFSMSDEDARQTASLHVAGDQPHPAHQEPWPRPQNCEAVKIKANSLLLRGLFNSTYNGCSIHNNNNDTLLLYSFLNIFYLLTQNPLFLRNQIKIIQHFQLLQR